MIRRRLVPTGEASASIYSLTQPGKAVKHSCSFDPITGKAVCSCSAFKFTKGHDQATVYTPDLWCKHLFRHAENLLRKGNA